MAILEAHLMLCPHCSCALEVAPELHGQRVRCGRCRAECLAATPQPEVFPPLPSYIGWYIAFALSPLLLVALGLGIYFTVAVPRWKVVQPEAAGFVISMPGKTAIKYENVGSLTVTMMGTTRWFNTEAYSIGYTDLTEHRLKTASANTILNEACADAVKNSKNGSELKRVDLVVEGYPAKQVTAKVTKEGRMTARIILVKNKLYTLYCIRTYGEQFPEYQERFLGSFELR